MNKPSASVLKTRYPEFGCVPDQFVDMFIDEASQGVDEEWRASDAQPAILALAAHLMSCEGYPQRIATNGASFNADGAQMIRHRVGDVEVQYAQVKSTDSGKSRWGDLQGTVYGRRYAQLQKANAAGIWTV